MRRAPIIAAAALAGFAAPLLSPVPLPTPPLGEPVSLSEAVALCRDSCLQGWALVEFARQLVGRRFVEYSWATPWERPATAFRHGRGYCAQYNVALRDLLRELGIEADAVFAARVRLGDTPWWRTGHVWLRVRVDGRTRDVCARHCDGPGDIRFIPVTEVHPFGCRTQINAAIWATIALAALRWRAIITRQPLPEWVHRSVPRL